MLNWLFFFFFFFLLGGGVESEETYIYIKWSSKQNLQWYHYTTLRGRFQKKALFLFLVKNISALPYPDLFGDQ